MPLVSIVTMNHNYGHFLTACCDSVRAQTFKDFEHIVLNAGCTDDSNSIAWRMPGIRLLNIADCGLCGSRNYGVGIASGKYIVNLDADDKIHPQFLEKLVPHAGPKKIVCPGMSIFGNGHAKIIPGAVTYAAMQKNNNIFCCSMFCKADFLAIGGYDEKLNWSGYEDWLLWLDLLKQGATITVVRELLFYYRVHSGSSTARRGHLEEERVSYIRKKHSCLIS